MTEMEQNPFRPFWIPDELFDSCMSCGVGFSIFVRKHHCRCCGKIFCGNCSNYWLELPEEFQYEEPQRVCKQCYERSTAPEEEFKGRLQRFLRKVPYYYLEMYLFDFGSRYLTEKVYSLVATTIGEQYFVLTNVKLENEVSEFYEKPENAKTFRKLFETGIDHPNIAKCDRVVFNEGNVFLFRPYFKGSLRDLICQIENPRQRYADKYAIVGSPLSITLIRHVCTSILEGLIYLESNQIPFPHLHTANVLLDMQGNFLLTDIENSFLHLRPHLQDYLKNDTLHEITCFGHVLYEMATGIPLGSRDLKTKESDINPEAFTLLLYIFEESPTLQELCNHTFFSSHIFQTPPTFHLSSKHQHLHNFALAKI